MEDIYLKLPLQFNGDRFKTASIQDSVVKIVSIVISTPKGSSVCDKNFGTAQMDPSKVLVEVGAIKEDLSKTIRAALEQSEPRLDNISVKVHGGVKSAASGTKPLKIEINATLAATGKKFKLEKTLKEDYYRAPFPGRMG
ncbi:MAG: GPW/gp25 family protein [candidate division Zixibacteria bacterium]|nr:GPW/gp25 family protein [candidate division Zixibacteria bacterium]